MFFVLLSLSVAIAFANINIAVIESDSGRATIAAIKVMVRSVARAIAVTITYIG